MIKLDDNYWIEPDTHSWKLVLSEKKVKQDGKEYDYTDVWYFPTIKDCMVKYTDQALKVSVSVSGLLETLTAVEKKLDSICPKIYVANKKLVYGNKDK